MRFLSWIIFICCSFSLGSDNARIVFKNKSKDREIELVLQNSYKKISSSIGIPPSKYKIVILKQKITYIEVAFKDKNFNEDLDDFLNFKDRLATVLKIQGENIRITSYICGKTLKNNRVASYNQRQILYRFNLKIEIFPVEKCSIM